MVAVLQLVEVSDEVVVVAAAVVAAVLDVDHPVVDLVAAAEDAVAAAEMGDEAAVADEDLHEVEVAVVDAVEEMAVVEAEAVAAEEA